MTPGRVHRPRTGATLDTARQIYRNSVRFARPSATGHIDRSGGATGNACCGSAALHGRTSSRDGTSPAEDSQAQTEAASSKASEQAELVTFDAADSYGFATTFAQQDEADQSTTVGATPQDGAVAADPASVSAVDPSVPGADLSTVVAADIDPVLSESFLTSTTSSRTAPCSAKRAETCLPTRTLNVSKSSMPVSPTREFRHSEPRCKSTLLTNTRRNSPRRSLSREVPRRYRDCLRGARRRRLRRDRSRLAWRLRSQPEPCAEGTGW